MGIDTSMLFLTDFMLILSPISIKYNDDLHKIYHLIFAQWYKDVNPNNIFQFIPNINFMKPYVNMYTTFTYLFGSYINSDENKLRIKYVAKKIGNIF